MSGFAVLALLFGTITVVGNLVVLVYDALVSASESRSASRPSARASSGRAARQPRRIDGPSGRPLLR